MTKDELETVLSLILNESDFQEIEVIQKALERRAQDLNRVGSVHCNPKGMAQRAAREIQAHLGFTQERIYTMTADMIRGVLREKAPELSEEEIEALLGAWAPAPGTVRPEATPIQRQVPQDAVITMTQDFLASAEGCLGVSREAELRDHIGNNWRKVVWDRLPERVCRLIVVFLEGKIGRETFWSEVRDSLTR